MLELPSSDALKSTFDYDPASGELRWKAKSGNDRITKRWNTMYVGQLAGAVNTNGHRQVRVNGRLYLAHRVIWKMMTGDEPSDRIDHDDGDYDNNRWKNLRDATQQNNSWNRKARHDNRSGLLGVSFSPNRKANPYAAMIYHEGKLKHLGVFPTAELASAAYQEAFLKYRGDQWLRKN